jgi:hypothetical protein
LSPLFFQIFYIMHNYKGPAKQDTENEYCARSGLGRCTYYWRRQQFYKENSETLQAVVFIISV